MVSNQTIWQNRVKNDNETSNQVQLGGKGKTLMDVQRDNLNAAGVLKICGLMLAGALIYKFIDKKILDSVIKMALPPTDAGLLSGILLGEKAGISKKLYEDLAGSGLVHLVVASGANIMLLVGNGVEMGSRYFGRKTAILFFVILGWWYAGLVGWEPPIIRAMLLVSLTYLAQLTGRKFNLTRAIVVAVLIMAAADVRLIFTVSFWLSICAFVGIVIAGNYDIRLRWRNKKLKLKVLTETVLVSLVVTPILAMIFGKISLAAPIANVIVVGVMELVAVTGMIGVLAGLVVYDVGKIILWLTIPGLRLLEWVAVNFGGGTIMVKFNIWMMVGWYMILFFFLVKFKKLKF